MKPEDKSTTISSESVEDMFRQYYSLVCNTINYYLRDRVKTEDVAQDVFAELWSKRDHLVIHTSVPAYLRKMAITRTLNYLRDSKKHNWEELESPDDGIFNATEEPAILNQLEASDLSKQLDMAISQLPDKCRVVFLLSRVEELSYAEIGSQLGISVKTVENQIGKALKHLRRSVSTHRG